MGYKRQKIRREIYDNDIIGVVEDINDPKRIGRARVRLEWIHGRKDDKNSIPTEDLPWLEPSSRGNTFFVSSVGKVVYVAFENNSYYKGSYFAEEHYDINLQTKLDSLSADDYKNFYSMYFDATHQYYYQPKEGIVFDYKKSNINLRDNGDIRLNLKDNTAKLFLGSPDASQQAILGNHWMTLFDELVQNLLGAYGGPYLGNLGAPVIAHPKMIEWCNKYLAIRETLLSDHVFIVDDKKVKPNKRKFDTLQSEDNWNTEKMERTVKSVAKLPETEDRTESISNPDNVPPTNAASNLTTLINPSSPDQTESNKLQKPFDNAIENGKIPLNNMTISKYLSKSFSDDNDERKYLLNDPATYLDRFLDDYHLNKVSAWSDVIPTNGYNNYERQINIKKQFPTLSPDAGNNPYGFGNQVELYFGVNKGNSETRSACVSYIRNGTVTDKFNETKVLDWLVKNSKRFGYKLAGRNSDNSEQWHHWIFDPSLLVSVKEDKKKEESTSSPKKEEESKTTINYTFKVIQNGTDIIANILYNGSEIGSRTYAYASATGQTSENKIAIIKSNLQTEADSFGFSFNGKFYGKTSK